MCFVQRLPTVSVICNATITFAGNSPLLSFFASPHNVSLAYDSALALALALASALLLAIVERGKIGRPRRRSLDIDYSMLRGILQAFFLPITGRPPPIAKKSRTWYPDAGLLAVRERGWLRGIGTAIIVHWRDNVSLQSGIANVQEFHVILVQHVGRRKIDLNVLVHAKPRLGQKRLGAD